MHRLLPTARSASIGLLVLIGIGCLLSFNATVAGLGLTAEATAVDPAADAGTVATASSDVANLDRRLDDPVVDAPVESVAEAARSGSYEGSMDPAVQAEINGLDARYAVYEGSYYRWNGTTSTESGDVRLGMEPVDATTVVNDVATPYEEASPAAKRVIRTGSSSVDELPTGVFVRDGTYYAITPVSTGEVASVVLRGAASYLLSLVGPGYLAVGIGLAVVRLRSPGSRPVTPRRAAAVASAAVPIGIAVAAASVSGPPVLYLIYPGVGSAVAAGFVAGVFARRSQWLALAGVTALVGGLGVVGSFVAGGVGGALVGAVGVVVAVVAGALPFVYGVVFASDPG